MRQGQNPGAQQSELPAFLSHRVIIPVYIPELTGYFQNSLQTLRLCLESLRLTTANTASVTIISNGSAPEIVSELEQQYEAGWIDQLILNRDNWGKIDAVVSAARGAFEQFITFSDCDVLFKPGWLEAVDRIFHAFPECGFVSPVPAPNMTWYHSSATILGALLRRELSLRKVVPEGDLDQFARSVGRPDLFDAACRNKQLVVRRGEIMACVGCGHFVCTVRRDVVAHMPSRPSRKAILGNSEEIWLDMPADIEGRWRLAPTQAYAWHMGNVPEPWMYDEIAKYTQATSFKTAVNGNGRSQKSWISLLPWWVRTRLLGAVRFAVTRRIQQQLMRATQVPSRV